jgi:fatty-acid desaturase
MLKDKSKLIGELDWLNMKSYCIAYLSANLVCILIVVLHGVLPSGWMGFILGGVAYIVIMLIQRRMARKLADKIMKAHKEDYTVYVETSLKAKR